MVTVASVTPAAGLTGGRTLVEVTGTGFALTGVVVVRFDGVPATGVRVRSATSLDCRTPIGPVAGPVDVQVENQTPLASATLVDGYTYRRPDLTGDSVLVRATFALVRQIKKQVLARNVVVRTHPDYHLDEPPARQTQHAKLPQIILRGPDLTENRFDSTNERTLARNLGAGTYEAFYEPWVADAEFDVVVRSDNWFRHANLVVQAARFFHQNPYLGVPESMADPSSAEVRYELRLLEAFRTLDPGADDLAAGVVESLGVCQIRGLLIEVPERLERGPFAVEGPPSLTTEVL